MTKADGETAKNAKGAKRVGYGVRPGSCRFSVSMVCFRVSSVLLDLVRDELHELD